ncbi:MAG: TIGR04283 family arsenosugar biosynthesis glycosyltransferase [Chthoniobacterales bacterium]|nr:TIGR04283 family arsenosugar biosynthesis glycosyltransferase [Chthoniobacterales bacterium]
MNGGTPRAAVTADAGAQESTAAAFRISVVIPSWRDAENLARLLPGLSGVENVGELIVVDASGDPASEKIARENGATFLKCSAPNRGAQMNVGAKLAAGDAIIFQHADTELRSAHVAAVCAALRNPAIVGGAFYRKFDERHPRLMWLEHVARFLTRHGGTLYGDQSVFVRREVFLRLQGFAQIPLMEDMEFSRRLRATGKIAVLDPPVRTSARRHAREGAWKTSIQNGLFILLYKLGVSPARLHRWYYRIGGRTARAADLPKVPTTAGDLAAVPKPPLQS